MTWAVSAWFLFRSQGWLWMYAALPFVLTFAAATLFVTGHLRPIIYSALSALGLSLRFQTSALFLILLALPLALLMANTAMTAMANKIVRGQAIGIWDLFQLRGFGVTSLVLVITLLAIALGSLAFFVGALIAAGLLVGAQSTALRTGSLSASLRASVSVLRADPIRILGLATLLLLVVMLGFITGGLALLVAIPVVKIIGGLADAYAETLRAAGALTPMGRTPAGKLMPHTAQFHWTADEEVMLHRTVPPPYLPHILAAWMVVGLATFLLFPRIPAATADQPVPQNSPTQPTAVTQAPSVSPAPQTQGDSSPVASSTAAASPVFVDSYGTDNYPPLPCQMHWGIYTVRIEKVGSTDGPNGPQEKLTVLDTAESPVYTLTDEHIESVKPEPLLGGGQPEILIRTSEGADGTHGMEVGLTQQGGVHPVFVVSDKRVTPLHVDGEAYEEIVVDAPLDGPYLDVHHFPLLTSTYKWNGTVFENANASSPASTEDRIRQYEKVLTDPVNSTQPANDMDDWGTSMETAAVGLLANISLVERSRLPVLVTSTHGYQLGTLWLRANNQSRLHIVQQISEAKRPLSIVDSGSANDESGLPDQPSQP